MELREIASIVNEVRLTYSNQFKDYPIKEMLELYEKHLMNEDYEKVIKNLDNHIKTSKFAPSIADLIKRPENFYRVPTFEETQKDLERLEQWRKEACTAEEAKAYIKKIADNFLRGDNNGK